MTREKALIKALDIINTCMKYGNEDRCNQCPYNFNGCIVCSDGDIPAEWRLHDMIEELARRKKQ